MGKIQAQDICTAYFLQLQAGYYNKEYQKLLTKTGIQSLPSDIIKPAFDELDLGQMYSDLEWISFSGNPPEIVIDLKMADFFWAYLRLDEDYIADYEERPEDEDYFMERYQLPEPLDPSQELTEDQKRDLAEALCDYHPNILRFSNIEGEKEILDRYIKAKFEHGRRNFDFEKERRAVEAYKLNRQGLSEMEIFEEMEESYPPVRKKSKKEKIYLPTGSILKDIAKAKKRIKLAGAGLKEFDEKI